MFFIQMRKNRNEEADMMETTPIVTNLHELGQMFKHFHNCTNFETVQLLQIMVFPRVPLENRSLFSHLLVFM